MSNIHRFKPRPKAPPPPRRHPSWARSGWLPWVLVLAAAVLLTVLGLGGSAVLGALGVVLVGALLHQRG